MDDEEGSGNEGWRLAWRDDAAARGWRSAARVQWAPPAGGGAPRLLAAGPLALADRWEVTLFQFDGEDSANATLQHRLPPYHACVRRGMARARDVPRGE